MLATNVTSTLVQHWSVQAGGLVGTGLPQVMVRLLHSNSGAEMFITVTVKLQLLELPQQSSAVQMTVVTVPGPNEEQEGGVQVTVTLLQQALLAVTL